MPEIATVVSKKPLWVNSVISISVAMPATDTASAMAMTARMTSSLYEMLIFPL